MKMSIVLIPLFFLCGLTGVSAQSPVSNYPAPDPLINISAEMTNISRSVQTLNTRLKEFVDKWEKVGGLTLSEKQQKLVMGLELLTRTEARVANFQKFQVDFTDKLNEMRNRLGQVENELRPQNIDRAAIFESTTDTAEYKEVKRLKLQNERTNLTVVVNQLQSNLAENADNLKEAQALAYRLRKTFLPQIERELYEQ